MKNIFSSLIFLSEIKRWICERCCYDVCKTHVILHLKKIHRYTSKQICMIVIRCQEKNEDAMKSILLMILIALSHLLTYDDELTYAMNEICLYICRRIHQMQRHCWKQHQWTQFKHREQSSHFIWFQMNTSNVSKLWKSVWCQRIYSSDSDSTFFVMKFAVRWYSPHYSDSLRGT